MDKKYTQSQDLSWILLGIPCMILAYIANTCEIELFIRILFSTASVYS